MAKGQHRLMQGLRRRVQVEQVTGQREAKGWRPAGMDRCSRQGQEKARGSNGSRCDARIIGNSAQLIASSFGQHKATWEHYLPLVEYAYNNIVHTSTGKAPFEIVEGGKKVPPILHTKDKIFEADKYVQNTDEAYKKIKLALEKTQSKQKKAADRHRRKLVFSLGDWVLLRFEKARLRKIKGKERLFPKLGMRCYGRFQVCDKIGDAAYRLELPEDWKIHNAFHVSLLTPFVGDVPEDMVPKEQPEVEELDEILVPEQILAHKDRKVRGKVARRYLVKFKNYSPMESGCKMDGRG
ncbi:hypothetical protein L7F22_033095 [Adiantum nelumboides]|nr:hypothetical protein [Adiantum nelumboides]